MCRGGRRPADPCSKQGMGERMQSAAGDLCSALVFILCYHRRNKEISAWQQSPGRGARQPREEGKALLQDVDLLDLSG